MENVRPPPGGTVTFLFTDIEGSTKLWEEHPEAMRLALARHDALLRETLQSHGGHVFKSMGDQFCAAFVMAPQALAAALTAQRALGSEPWGEVGPVRVRMALHTGAAEQRDGDYFGPPLNRVARLLEAAHGGQVLVSLATEELVREALLPGASLRNLGLRRLKDLNQPEHVFQLLHPDLPGDFPPLRSLEAFAHNLPAQLTSFIGRAHEMAEAKELLATTRLLTLTGSGGCGKTRLALQVAADLLEQYPDGVWLVELAPLADPALVPQSVASALGVREEPGRPLTATLTDYLRPKSLLLMLDNCEHLLSACARLSDALLRSCPNLRLLASSREGLGIGGEQTYRVPSLTMPDARHVPPLETLQEFEAVQLFADRAHLSQSTFAVTEENAPAVVKVCQRLDGIPLAIELAAARVKVLPIEKIAERLDDRFRLLTGGSRTALPRQQTLRALIDWSYELLSAPEQTLLRRLSVFASGWTLEAAEAVCAGEPIEGWEVLDLLTALIEKSLVVYSEGEAGGAGGASWGPDPGRYRLLETVRQYARDRLLETSETATLRDRHLAFFLHWVKVGPERVGRARPAEWSDHMEREHDNLRTALEWSLTAEGSAETALRLATALVVFWMQRGYAGEGREWLTRALATSGRAPAASRAQALHAAGTLADRQGDYGAARALFEESLSLFRGLGDPSNTALALQSLAFSAFCQAEYEQAKALTEEALAIQRELGNQEGVAEALMHLGFIARGQGNSAAERSHYEQALALRRELGAKWGIAHSLHNLGHVARTEGNYEVARLHYKESLTAFHELADTPNIAQMLEGFAALAAVEGDLWRSARLWGGADALHEALSLPMPPVDHITHDPYIEAVRTALGEEAFATAWAEGRAMSPEDAIRLALED